MEFIKPQMERILFDAEDIIVTSTCTDKCSTDCTTDGTQACNIEYGDVGCTGDILN